MIITESRAIEYMRIRHLPDIAINTLYPDPQDRGQYELMCIEYQVGEYNACFDALARIVNSCSESLQALAEAFMRVGEELREVFCTDIEEAYLPKQSQKRATKELVCKLVEEPKLDKRKGIQKNVRNHRY